MDKKRYTLTIGPVTQKALAQLARKFSTETNTSWTAQDVLERCANAGMHKLSTKYYPRQVVVTIDC